jgi:GPH family glycoside/pentoside/hexuronide:cation symporter
MTEVFATQADVIETTKGGASGNGGALPMLAPLTFLQKVNYAWGDFAEAIVSIALGQFLLFYLTAVVGMSGSAAGGALALTLVVDAMVDPAVGYMSDNIRSRLGRRHPFMFAAIIPMAFSIALIFSIPKMESQALLFAYVVGVLLMLRFSYSVFVLPYIALGAELTRDYHERSVLQVYRNFFNISGNILTVNLGLGLFMAGAGGLLSRDAYVPFGWTCAGIIVVSTLLCALGTMSVRHRMYEVAPPDRSALARLPGELRDVFRNHSFLMLLLTIVIFWIAQGSAINLSVYTYSYFWKVDANTIRIVLTSGTIGLFAGIPVCAFLLGFMEKKTICTGAIVIVCGLLFAPPVFRIIGLLPETGYPLLVILSAFTFIQSVVLTNVFISFNSMMVDATDEHDLLFGVRREGLYFSALSFSGKAALGIGSLFAGFALDYIIMFPHDLAAHPNQIIPVWTLTKLGLIAGPGAAAISALSAFAMSRYRISKARLHEIQAELAKRNQP